jgi:hypothetical protein
MTWFNIIAGIASIAGFVFSLLAWIRAGRASKAATEARDAITLRTLADEFQTACERMDQLLDLIVNDRLAGAALRANELASTLSEVPYRRSPYMTESRKNELLTASSQMQIISEEIIAVGKNPLTPEKKQELSRICRQCSATLRKNLGIIKGEIDTGAKR